MSCSPARLEANRRNALRSSGPKTAEGKANSRRNALKHGLAGEGIALPNEDAAEVERRFASFEAELDPRGDFARVLVQRAALLSVRMERCVRHEAASLSEKVRHAIDEYDEAKLAEVASLAERLATEPETATRRLRKTSGGIAWMLARWAELRVVLNDSEQDEWADEHREAAEGLAGRKFDEARPSRWSALTDGLDGIWDGLDAADGKGLDDPAKRVWARKTLDAMIGTEIDGLRDALGRIDIEAEADDRAGAADRALFDDSPKAILARRYEAAAERGFFRALRALKEHPSAAIETEIVVEPDSVAEAEATVPLGSFRPVDPPAPEVVPIPLPIAAAPIPVGSSGAAGGSRPGRASGRPTDAFDVVIGRPPVAMPQPLRAGA